MNFEKKFSDFIKTPNEIYLDKFDRSKQYIITSNWKDAYSGIICKYLLNYNAPNTFFIKQDNQIYSVIQVEKTEQAYLLPKNRGLGMIIALREILAIDEMNIQIINRNGKKMYYTGIIHKPFQFKTIEFTDFKELIEYDQDVWLEATKISKSDLIQILDYCEKNIKKTKYKNEILNRLDQIKDIHI